MEANGGTPVGGERLTWDTNQMRKGLSRKIFATLQERAGHDVVLMEQVATELSRLVNPRNPGPGLQQLYTGIKDPDPIRHLLVYKRDPRETIRHQIWWAEEMHRPEGIYKVRLLSPEEEARYDELMDTFASSGARRVLTEEQIREDPDAIILCQAAATGEKVIVTANIDSINIAKANAWARREHARGRMQEPELVVLPEEQLRHWCTVNGPEVLRGIMAAAWPSNVDASRGAVESRMKWLWEKMEGTKDLRDLAVSTRHEYEDTRAPDRMVEEVRHSLAVRERQSDQRHPANPRNTRRNWSIPEDGGRQVVEVPRWQLRMDETNFEIAENVGNRHYEVRQRIPVRNTKTIIETLVRLGIEVKGLPRHDGKDDGGGFGTAMRAVIDEELAKARARTRS